MWFTISAYIGKCIKNLRLKLGKNTDERLQATQETLTAIKIIKMYTWERVFIGRVEEKRKYKYQNTVNHTLNLLNFRKEMEILLKSAYLGSLTFLLGVFTSKIGQYLLMMIYIAFTESADSEVLFYVMRAFHDLKHSLGIIIPISCGKMAEIIASGQRINKILNAEEVEPSYHDDDAAPKVKLSGVSVKVVT